MGGWEQMKTVHAGDQHAQWTLWSGLLRAYNNLTHAFVGCGLPRLTMGFRHLMVSKRQEGNSHATQRQPVLQGAYMTGCFNIMSTSHSHCCSILAHPTV